MLSAWLALALPLALLLVGTFVPAGLARPAGEGAAERKAQHAVEREQRRNERIAQRESQREAKRLAAVGGSVRFSCTGIRWTYAGFPDQPGNRVEQQITINHNHDARTRSVFTFDGSTGTNTTPLMAPPGKYQIDTWAYWRTNGVRGHFDIRGKVKCPPTAAFTIEKLQRIQGSGGSFTTSELKGLPGQTVQYEMIVRNTGNVPLTLGPLTDPKCDGGTLSGGPVGGTLPVEGSATYTCSHLLTAADQEARSYTNSASVTATPPESAGAPVEHTSNTVVVAIPSPAFTIFKLQRIAGGGGFFTMAGLEALPGSTIDYEVIVKDTGNVPLTMGPLSDPKCDAGTIAGGPGGAPLAPGASTTYTCSHVLNAADEAAGSYTNTATLTGTPPDGEGSQITNTSNTVVVTVTTNPGPPTPRGGGGEGEIPGGGGPTPGTPTPGGGTASGTTSTVTPTSTPTSSSGVLAFASATVPALVGPQGCARGRVTIRIKSAGVMSVIFYLDGHRIKRLTAHSAKRGQLTLVIDTSRLKVGRHRLLAKFTMKAASSARVTHASRAINLLRCASGAVTPRFTG